MSTTAAKSRLEQQVQDEQAAHDAEERQRNEETTEPTRQLETVPGSDSPSDDEAEQEEPAAPPADPEGKKLFDDEHYEREDLAIQKVDGQQIDKIRIAFSGSVLLDRSAPADVAVYNKLKLGAEVDLRVAGKVSGAGSGFTTNRDGDLDALVGEKKLKVETVWVLTPEEL